jgi:hypothetical protein
MEPSADFNFEFRMLSFELRLLTSDFLYADS